MLSAVLEVYNDESEGAAAVDKVVKENITTNNIIKLSNKLTSCINEGRK